MALKAMIVLWQQQDNEEQVSVQKGARRSRRARATVQRYDPVLGTDRPQPRRGKRGLLETLDEEVALLLRLSHHGRALGALSGGGHCPRCCRIRMMLASQKERSTLCATARSS